ncbi:MAG: LVIVD repeat-containing protein [Bacteroidales bacterium]
MRKLFFILILVLYTTISFAQFIFPVSTYMSNAKNIKLSNFDIKDTLLFLPLGNEDLQILTISDLTNLKDFSKYNEYEIRYRERVYGKALNVKVIGNRAYLAYGELGLKIIDITDPATPYSIATYYRHHDVNCVEIYENYALLGFAGLGLEIINFSDLENLEMISRSNILGFTINNIQILPPYIMISGGSRGLKTFKFQDPFTSFKPVEFPKDFIKDAPANKLLVRASTGYLANDYGSLSVLNLNLPLYPHEVKELKTNGKPVDLLIDRNYLYVACTKTIEVYDIREPEKPEKIFEHIDKDKKFQHIYIQGTHLFASFTQGKKQYGIMVFQIE